LTPAAVRRRRLVCSLKKEKGKAVLFESELIKKTKSNNPQKQ
jgi:hypothetical protein